MLYIIYMSLSIRVRRVVLLSLPEMKGFTPPITETMRCLILRGVKSYRTK
jgi:hypothetical protein